MSLNSVLEILKWFSDSIVNAEYAFIIFIKLLKYALLNIFSIMKESIFFIFQTLNELVIKFIHIIERNKNNQ